MTHSDPDVLAMMAMGESGLPEADLLHIESCAPCRSEVRSLRRVADLARSSRPDEPFASPSPMVWTRIADAVGIDPGAVGSPESALSGAAPTSSVSMGSVPAASVPTGFGYDAARGHGPRADGAGRARDRRSRSSKVAAGVAALAVIAGAVTTVVVLQRDRPVVVGEARLGPLAGGPALTGDATVEEHPDGTRDVAITVDSADVVASADTYREVWLLSSDLTRLVSLGVLDGSDGRYVIPDSVDLADFPVIDVSVEPLDGDPAHSGDSIVQGTLEG